MIMIAVPMVAPAVGLIVVKIGGWRSIFAFYVALAAVAGLWLAARQLESLRPELRIPIRLRPLLGNALAILRNLQVMAIIVATGFVFGAQLLFLSIAPAIFEDIYAVGDRFPLYFALLAGSIGLAFFVNSMLVTRYGMERLVTLALVLLAGLGAALAAIAWVSGGRPDLRVFMAICIAVFFCFGLLFGNLNAMAMQPLGKVAGIAASLIASISSLVAFIFATVAGHFYDGAVTPLAMGFVAVGVGGWLLLTLAGRPGDLP